MTFVSILYLTALMHLWRVQMGSNSDFRELGFSYVFMEENTL